MQGAYRGGFSFTPKVALMLLAGYYLLHVVVRTLVSDSLHLDEAEQLIVTQEWRWGYGSQPPLYNWIQMLVFSLFGPSVLSLALLKNLLLFGIAGLTFLSAREVFQDPSEATDAMLSLLFVPGLVWESQRDQTHLVLATLLSAATFFLFLRLARLRQTWLFLACGVVAGLGVLAKYNFALVLVAVTLAAASIREIRGALNPRGALLFLCGFLLVTAAHFWWMAHHRDLVLAQSQSFGQKMDSPGVAAVLGLGQVLLRIVEYGAAPVLVFAGYWLVKDRREVGPVANPAGLQLLRRTVMIGLGLVLVIAMVFQVTRLKARWLQPLLIVLPILLVAAARPHLTAAGRWRLAVSACCVMLVVPVLLYGRVLAAGLTGKTTSLNHPYSAWAGQLREAGFTNGNILAYDKTLAGNLKLQFPASRVVLPEFTDVALLTNAPVLIVWKPAESETARAEAMQFAERMHLTGLTALPLGRVTAPARYQPLETLSLGFVRGPELSAIRQPASAGSGPQ